ncbi:hypothetical protein [Caulobacter endophyticus]|uniref:hypothetical protein n=1 Tax=Caulobacter endophyticus TaxID=2172652 RepID=UPI00240F9B24|nr:hypothetical protein [Caulobacter endophyticus]MDG2531664.1 hypothetical protein [Caulobacter endophyticus]
MRGLALALGAAAALAVAASPAAAERRMFSYDPISPDAKRLTGAGLTVLFEQGLLSARPIKVLATGVPAQALLRKAGPKDLGKGGLASMPGVDTDAALYEVNGTVEQGKVYVRAFCPGSKRLWLSFSRIALRHDLRIQAFGDDPKAAGQARLCGTLDFAYRGEWRLPTGGPPDPNEDWTDSLNGPR